MKEKILKLLDDYPKLQKLAEQFMKFSLVGVFYTGASLTANFILLKYFKTPLIPTYVSVYICSVMVAYVLNSKYTFKSSLSLKKMALYYLVYLSSMGLGVVLLSIYKEIFTFENWVYPFFVFPFTVTWNFLFASRILKSMAADHREKQEKKQESDVV